MTISPDYHSQGTEINLIGKLSQFLTSKTFVDIGAEKGLFASTMLELGMTGALFEPMPKHRPGLRELVSRYKGAALHICAVTDVDTRQRFNVATDANGRELDYYHSLQKADTPGVFSHSKSFEVECRSLRSLTERGEIPSEIGILKTDTEGNDLNVLRGLGSLRPEIVICEYFTSGLYSGWSEGAPENIIEYMRGLDYHMFLVTKRIDDLEFIELCMPLFEEKQWGNLFFFREDFYEKANLAIAECVLNNEKDLLGKLNKSKSELEAKEKVIKLLDAEVDRLTKLQKELGLFRSIYRKVRSWAQ